MVIVLGIVTDATFSPAGFACLCNGVDSFALYIRNGFTLCRKLS